MYEISWKKLSNDKESSKKWGDKEFMKGWKVDSFFSFFAYDHFMAEKFSCCH